MTIATMARIMKKIIKMIAMTIFRFVIFWGEGPPGGGGGKKGAEANDEKERT